MMDIYERACTCGECARTLLIEPVYRVTVYDDGDKMAASQTMTEPELLAWLDDDDTIIEDTDNLYSIDPDADDVRRWLASNEAADLRRQLAAALAGLNTTLMDAIAARNEANVARAERQEFRTAFIVADAAFAAESAQRERADADAADLRRQLAEMTKMRDREVDQVAGNLRRELMEQAARHDLAKRFVDRDIADLRRQLAEARAEIAAGKVGGNFARAEAADLRRQLVAVPRDEIAELCDLIKTSTTAISLDCPAGWAVREWLETYDTPATGEGAEQCNINV